MEKILNALHKQVLQNDIKMEEGKFLVCTCSTCSHRGFMGNLWRDITEVWNVAVSVDPRGLNEVEALLAEGV